MPYAFVSAIFFTVLCAASVAYPQVAQQKSKPAQDARLDRETPEGTLRVFVLGVMISNEQLLKATMIPVSEEDLAYLLQEVKGDRPDVKKIKETCASAKVRAMKPGDVVTLPGGKKATVGQDEVTDTSMVLVYGDSPVPTRLHKAQGYWWVDAKPVIAGRKAAEGARRKSAKDSTEE